MSDAVSDRADIERVVQLYIDGTRDGNAAKLRYAFHEDARMFGSLGGQRHDVPISELFAMSDGNPADVNGSYQARIVALEQVGDTASATIEEDGFWGNVSFTDLLSLGGLTTAGRSSTRHSHTPAASLPRCSRWGAQGEPWRLLSQEIERGASEVLICRTSIQEATTGIEPV